MQDNPLVLEKRSNYQLLQMRNKTLASFNKLAEAEQGQVKEEKASCKVLNRSQPPIGTKLRCASSDKSQERNDGQ
jgi:hypothetical protein